MGQFSYFSQVSSLDYEEKTIFFRNDGLLLFLDYILFQIQHLPIKLLPFDKLNVRELSTVILLLLILLLLIFTTFL